jgi:ABC-type phosphate/phosphonate transport system substrate-binding protein
MRTSANAAQVDSVIAAAKSRVARSVTRGVDVGELRAAWSGLTSDLERVVGADVKSVVGASHNDAHRTMHP